jgi:hypothetical protein
MTPSLRSWSDGRPVPPHEKRDVSVLVAIVIAILAVSLVEIETHAGTSGGIMQQHAQTLVDASLSLPGNQSTYAFTVPTGSVDASLQGNFTVLAAASQPAGQGDGVAVFVLNQAGFSDYQRGVDGFGDNALYSGAYSMASSFDVQVSPPGRYYLLFAVQAASPGSEPPTATGVSVLALANLVYTSCSRSCSTQ